MRQAVQNRVPWEGSDLANSWEGGESSVDIHFAHFAKWRGKTVVVHDQTP